MPLTPEQLKEQNDKKAAEELRIMWLKNNRHINWVDLGEGPKRDPKDDEQVELLRGEAKVPPRDPMTAGFKRREDGFFKRDVYFNGKDEVTLFGFATAKAIENAQQLLASQGMMTCTYDVTPARLTHIEALITRYCDALGVKVGAGGAITQVRPPEDPLKLLKLGPNLHAYIGLCTMGYFGRVVGKTWLGKLITGRAQVLLQLSKLCEEQYEQAKTNARNNTIGRNEIENLQRAAGNLNNTETHPPAPIAPADRANYVNNQFAAGDTPDAKLDKIGAKLDQIATRQQALLEEKAILTHEISESRRMIASADTRPDEIEELLVRLERQQDSRAELMEVMEREEEDLYQHLNIWRNELNTAQYAGNAKQRTHLNKIDELAGKPRVATLDLKQDYLQVEADAQARKAAPPPPAPAPGPAPRP